MPSDRLRSIVPMFGGATSYVDTLDEILAFVAANHPSTDELVGWHRGRFAQVSSRDSIRRRIDYLEKVGFLDSTGQRWMLGQEGEAYVADQSTDRLLEIMCRRNVGLRSLLYALLPGPMTINEINQHQLRTHPELAWDPSNTDMARQRANWLRSLGLVHKDDAMFELTDDGRRFAEAAVEEWAKPPSVSDDSDGMSAGTYETTVQVRAVDPEFRATVLSRYESTCPVSGVDHRGLLDVAHVLPWRDYPEYRADLSNVLTLSKTHHAAFDRGFFTIDDEYHLRVHPEFDTESAVLRRTILEQADERLPIPEHQIDPDYLSRYNEGVDWVSA